MGSIKVNVGFGGKSEKQAFRYMDIAVPVTKNNTSSDISDIRDLSSIRNSLHNLFTWRMGERILLPQFGNPLFSVVDEPITSTTENMIRKALSQMVEEWEPRVSLESINIQPDIDSHVYYIELTYIIPSLADKKESLAFSI